MRWFIIVGNLGLVTFLQINFLIFSYIFKKVNVNNCGLVTNSWINLYLCKIYESNFPYLIFTALCSASLRFWKCVILFTCYHSRATAFCSTFQNQPLFCRKKYLKSVLWNCRIRQWKLCIKKKKLEHRNEKKNKNSTFKKRWRMHAYILSVW